METLNSARRLPGQRAGSLRRKHKAHGSSQS